MGMVTSRTFLVLVCTSPGRHHGLVPEASLLRLLDVVVVDQHLMLQVQLQEGELALGSGSELLQPHLGQSRLLVTLVPG